MCVFVINTFQFFMGGYFIDFLSFFVFIIIFQFPLYTIISCLWRFLLNLSCKYEYQDSLGGIVFYFLSTFFNFLYFMCMFLPCS